MFCLSLIRLVGWYFFYNSLNQYDGEPVNDRKRLIFIGFFPIIFLSSFLLQYKSQRSVGRHYELDPSSGCLFESHCALCNSRDQRWAEVVSMRGRRLGFPCALLNMLFVFYNPADNFSWANFVGWLRCLRGTPGSW